MLTSGEANERPIFLLLQLSQKKKKKMRLSKNFFEIDMHIANKIGAEGHISVSKL